MNRSRRELLATSSGLLSLWGCGQDPLRSLLGKPPELPAPLAIEHGTLDWTAHVLQRCTFGPRPGEREALRALGSTEELAVAAWLERQLAPETIDDRACERAVRRHEALAQPAGELYEYRERILLRELTTATLQRAVHGERQLHEVVADFWTDHFNIDISKGECAWLKVADDRDVIRRHALGSFQELLTASALSPAMLWYLDGRVNRRASPEERPNENYARELLELHTLGVDGGYTQQDVMEVARCLTGWTVRDRERLFKARVEFHAELHDDGEKTVLGQSIAAGGGKRDIERVVEIVAHHPATARHVARKLCRRFLGEDARACAEVARAFEDSRGDIRATLRALFASESFRDPAVRGTKLKRPFHFLASCLRATAAETDCGPPLAEYLARMGHAPFQHPTPDGYPDETHAWTGTLLWRWRLASVLAQNELDGTRIDTERLTRRAGGLGELLGQLYGRRPTAEELAAVQGAGADALALALASPAFQRC